MPPHLMPLGMRQKASVPRHRHPTKVPRPNARFVSLSTPSDKAGPEIVIGLLRQVDGEAEFFFELVVVIRGEDASKWV